MYILTGFNKEKGVLKTPFLFFNIKKKSTPNQEVDFNLARFSNLMKRLLAGSSFRWHGQSAIMSMGFHCMLQV